MKNIFGYYLIILLVSQITPHKWYSQGNLCSSKINQLGQSFVGEMANDYSGSSVSANGDGRIVAIA